MPTSKERATMELAELQRYKGRLLEKQQELLFQDRHESPAPRAGASEGDLIDQANADSEAELQIRLRQSERHLSRAIDEALARMRRGTYGVCQTCNQPISKVRLEAVPWARRCRDCKESEPAA
jgi:DnaK suppressor protein